MHARFLISALALVASMTAGCGDTGAARDDDAGKWSPDFSDSVVIDLDVQLDEGVVAAAVDWTVSGNGLEPISGSLDMGAPVGPGTRACSHRTAA
jgi:hypothetical protein